jgi:I/LWEQ domain
LAVKADARRRDGPAYHEDPTWQDGLVSAAEFVVKSVRVLALAATRPQAEWQEGEFVANMLAGSRGITGAVARVCSSAAAKLEPSNAALTALNGAAGRTRFAASKLSDHARSNYSSVIEPAAALDDSASAVDKTSRQLEAMTDVG